jgi:chitin disaccharide deacetylase
MKQLVVNADDLGADEDRNAGIFDAIEAGSVTSVSILPNGPALEHALRGIRTLNLNRVSLGIHLNLSEGRPMEPGLRRICGPDGLFWGKSGAQQLLLHRGDAELEREICREASAQMMRIRDAGVAVDHLDGHQHVHVFPAVVHAAAEAAIVHRIPWVRIPEEATPTFPLKAVDSMEMEEATFFSWHASGARAIYRDAGMRATEGFRGLYLKGKLPADHWTEFMESLPPGITELMVHPGRFRNGIAGPFADFSTADRERELVDLTDGRFLDALLKAGVHLTRFPDIKN